METSPKRPIDRILEKASAKGWSNAELARQFDISAQNLNNWIHRDIPSRELLKAADLFHCTIEELLGRPLAAWPFRIPFRDFSGLDEDQKDELEEIVQDRIARFKAKQKQARKQGRA